MFHPLRAMFCRHDWQWESTYEVAAPGQYHFKRLRYRCPKCGRIKSRREFRYGKQ